MRRNGATPSKSAFRIALIYAVAAALWIFLSDKIAAALVPDRILVEVYIIKGWAFVTVTAVLLFVFVRRDLARVYKVEMEWRLLFDSVNDSIYIFRLTDNKLPGRFIDVNEAAIQRLGYSREEFQNLTQWDLTIPENHTELRQFLDKVAAEGAATLESIHLSKDDRMIPVELSARAIDTDGTVSVFVIARDITERKHVEAERREAMLAAEHDKRKFYRETILAVTQGKFELGEYDDAAGWIKKPELTIRVNGGEQLAEARHSLVDYCRRQGMVNDRVQEYELAIGEALGNAVKHAGSGWLYAGKRNERVWAAVVDEGTGIDTFAIPRVALLTGYTTKASMGLGYTMILEVCDHVKLCTGPYGTTVVMEKNLKEQTDADERMSIHSAIQ